MINFLHNFNPSPIIFNIGPLSLRWYGLFIVLGITAALLTSFYLAKKYYQIKKDLIFDLAFWLIIGGLIGARIYEVLLFLPYYINNPEQILAVWNGGMAIHGSIIAGIVIIYIFAKKQKINFFKLTALIVPGLALGQAIGRWGNYFNQEIFGKPTNLPWGIPIDIINRPVDFINVKFFHPTFLYESLGSLLIFFILLILTIIIFRRDLNPKKYYYILLTLLYMVLYSMLRFFLEFMRLDPTPEFLGMRWPQIISLAIIIFSFLILIFYRHEKKKQE